MDRVNGTTPQSVEDIPTRKLAERTYALVRERADADAPTEPTK